MFVGISVEQEQSTKMSQEARIIKQTFGERPRAFCLEDAGEMYYIGSEVMYLLEFLTDGGECTL